MNGRPEKYVFPMTVLKALQAVKTTSPFVRQCQKALNDMSTRQTVGLHWVPEHSGVRGNEIADKLARDGSVQKFVGPEPSPGVSRQNIRRKIKRWMDNQHLATYRGVSSTQETGSRINFGPQPGCKDQTFVL